MTPDARASGDRCPGCGAKRDPSCEELGDRVYFCGKAIWNFPDGPVEEGVCSKAECLAISRQERIDVLEGAIQQALRDSEAGQPFPSRMLEDALNPRRGEDGGA